MNAHALPTGALPSRGTPFERCLPGAALRELVAAYFSVRVQPDDASIAVRAVPDGCCDLMFDLRQPATAWMRGPRASATRYEHVGPTWLLGAQLLPGAAHAFNGQSTHLLAGLAVDLSTLCAVALQPVADGLRQAGTLSAQAPLFDSFLLQGFTARRIDPRIKRACAALKSTDGSIDIEALASACATSERNLSRLFKLWVGMGPKQLQRVLRFQRVLEAFDRGERPAWASLAHDLGYSDQSHLVREFAAFAGLPPESILNGTPAP
ncbi:MAG: AraC family transcriptional regulator [Rhizobacter sp.]